MRFILSMPPSINQTYGVSSRHNGARLYKRTEAVDWERSAGWEVKHQWKGRKMPLESDVSMQVVWYYHRDRDIDASLKILLDLFQKQRVYLNDRQVVELSVHKKQDLAKPRVEVEILPI